MVIKGYISVLNIVEMMKRGINMEEKIVEYLKLKGQANLKQIAKDTGHSWTTTVKYAERLKAKGVVLETKMGPARVFALAPVQNPST